MITGYRVRFAKKRRNCTVKVRLTPGSAKSGPPLSGLLAPYGINIIQFCESFNKISLALEINNDLDLDVLIYFNILKKSFSLKIKGVSVPHLIRTMYEENGIISFLDIFNIFRIKKFFMEKNGIKVNDLSLLKSIVHCAINYRENKTD